MRVCKVSVQGKCARREELHMGMGAVLQLPLDSLVSMGGSPKAVGKSGLRCGM